MILKCNRKCKSHGAGNLSPTHPSGQPSLSCPWTSPCIHCSVHNTIIFSLSHLSPIIVTGIFFSLQCLTEKKYYPSLCPFHFSSLSLSYVFLHLNSGFFTIFFFFASVHPKLSGADLLHIYCSLTGKVFFNSLGSSSLQQIYCDPPNLCEFKHLIAFWC